MPDLHQPLTLLVGININSCKAVMRRKEGKERHRYLTPREWKKLRRYVDIVAKCGREQEAQFPLYLRLAYETGRRRGELLKIQLINVDLDNGLLYLLDTKTNDDQEAPISDDLVQRLKAHPRRAG